MILKLSGFADGTIFIPLSSITCANSVEEYFFDPFVITDAVKSAVPAMVSVNSPPFEKIPIATISFTLFGVSKSVAPLKVHTFEYSHSH